MNKNSMPQICSLTLATLSAICLILSSGCAATSARSASPKRVLVVTTTTGFRHSSIPTAEKILGELAAKSGAFTVDYARVENNDPQFKGADGKPDKTKYEPA